MTSSRRAPGTLFHHDTTTGEQAPLSAVAAAVPRLPAPRDALSRGNRKDEGKSLSMEDCAAMAFKHISCKATALSGRRLPPSFLAFHASPLMMLWLHTVADYFRCFFLHRNAEIELQERLKCVNRNKMVLIMEDSVPCSLDAPSPVFAIECARNGLGASKESDSEVVEEDQIDANKKTKNHLSYMLAQRVVRRSRGSQDVHPSNDAVDQSTLSPGATHLSSPSNNPGLDVLSATSALIGSSRAARSAQAVAALTKSKKHLKSMLERTLMQLARVYCQIVMRWSNRGSMVADRQFFSCVFELTLLVLDLLMPKCLCHAQPELQRLITSFDHVNVCTATHCGGVQPGRAALTDGPAHVRPPRIPADISTSCAASASKSNDCISEDNAAWHIVKKTSAFPILKGRSSPSETDFTNMPVLTPRRDDLVNQAMSNVSASKRFLEAASVRFLRRRDIRQKLGGRRRAPYHSHNKAARTTSPLVQGIIDASHKSEFDENLRKIASTPLDKEDVWSVFGISDRLREVKQDERRPSEAVQEVPQKRVRSIQAGDTFAKCGILNRRYTPARASRLSVVQGTPARLSIPQNSIQILNQRLISVLTQRGGEAGDNQQAFHSQQTDAATDSAGGRAHRRSI